MGKSHDAALSKLGEFGNIVTVDFGSLSARRRLKMLVARDEDMAVDVKADGLHIPEGMLEEARATRCMSNPRFLSDIDTIDTSFCFRYFISVSSLSFDLSGK